MIWLLQGNVLPAAVATEKNEEANCIPVPACVGTGMQLASSDMAKDSNIIEPPSQRVTLSCVTGEAAGVKGERLGRKG